MRKALFFLLFFIFSNAATQNRLGTGQQPQLSVDSKGIVRLIYGDHDKIFCATSNDGKEFATPVEVAKIPGMHLGMTRGPQLASSKEFSLITAMDKSGDIHAFQLEHKTGKWKKIGNVNDVAGSAPEGLMSIAADQNNNFYAVWLDIREGKKNNICFSTLSASGQWSKNKFIYQSPEGSVCECCKPSVVSTEKMVSVMFRNWLQGSRDLYLVNSIDGGKTFGAAQKLGTGTWPLKGCPMDGGGLWIDNKKVVHTAWQREGKVYYAIPGKAETLIAEGRHTDLNDGIIQWQNGNDLYVKEIGGSPTKIGVGTALEVRRLSNKSTFAVWENDNAIVFKLLN